MKSKRGLSHVVQLSLIVVIAVISVVGYQSWYTTFETTTYSDIETKTGDLNSLNIDLVDSGRAFLLNSGPENITMQTLLVNGEECYPGINVVTGANTLDIRGCIERSNSSEVEITVITNEGIISETAFIDRDKVNILPPVQIWNTSFDESTGNDIVLDVATDSNDNIYIAVRVSRLGENDFGTTKFYTNGTEAWRDIIDGPNYEGPESIGIRNDEIYVAGTLSPSGTYNASIVNYDSLGTIQGTYYGEGSSTITGIAFDSNDNIVGSTYSGLNKFDSGGNLILNKEYTNLDSYLLRGITVDNNDNYILVGKQDEGSLDNSLILKVNSTGDEQWNYSTRFWEIDSLWDVKTDSQNNIYVVGSSWTSGYTEKIGTLMKLDSQGNQIFNLSLENGTYLNRLEVHNNHLYINGQINNTPTLFKYDLFGNLIWEYNSPTGTGSAWGISIDGNGDLIFVHSGSEMIISKLRER